ncbi:hypothetical protein [Ruegeria sp. HKCCD8929]|uniref:hypothetical protein n=1 Tax=Ruegeria sp. HKCCD8929 TaxID=2683006 RepID=UPI00148813D7|nr:hypothetical protein [Ruegeria sp. HKCCD8929]
MNQANTFAKKSLCGQAVAYFLVTDGGFPEAALWQELLSGFNPKRLNDRGRSMSGCCAPGSGDHKQKPDQHMKE